MIRERLHEDRPWREPPTLRTSAVTGRIDWTAMTGDMIGRGLQDETEDRVIRIETEKDINRPVEREAAAAPLISAVLQIEMLFSKDFPSNGHRKTLAAPFLPSCGLSTPTRFHPKCYLSKT